METTRMRRRATWVLAVAAISLSSLVALSNTGNAVPKPAQTQYYVSLGDSYSIGYQPLPTPGPTPGYTAYVARKKHMTLENFGCGGATTTSILDSVGCGAPAGSDAVAYPTQTQASAAEAFISSHPGQVGLVTVSIGGNDVTGCVSAQDPVACVSSADSTITTNVDTLVAGLRAATGPDVPIIGLTYPDVILGLYVFPAGSPNHALANLSVMAFSVLINPTLKAAYATAGGLFADVTAKSGAYTPLTKLVHSRYGVIPLAVAQVCKLTWFCQIGNIHATTKGYNLEGKLIVHTH